MAFLEMIPAAVWIGLSAVSALMFAGSLVALRFLIVRMPADYFVRERRLGGEWLQRHPAVHVLATIMKNVVGLALAALGVIMLFTPGQGVLLVLVGVSLLDVPGKRTIELRIIRNPTVLRTINKIRAHAGRPAIELPEAHEHAAPSSPRAKKRPATRAPS